MGFESYGFGVTADILGFWGIASASDLKWPYGHFGALRNVCDLSVVLKKQGSAIASLNGSRLSLAKKDKHFWGSVGNFNLFVMQKEWLREHKQEVLNQGDGEWFVSLCIARGIEFPYAVALRSAIIRQMKLGELSSSQGVNLSFQKTFKNRWCWLSIYSEANNTVKNNELIGDISLSQNQLWRPTLQDYCAYFQSDQKGIPNMLKFPSEKIDQQSLFTHSPFPVLEISNTPLLSASEGSPASTQSQLTASVEDQFYNLDSDLLESSTGSEVPEEGRDPLALDGIKMSASLDQSKVEAHNQTRLELPERDFAKTYKPHTFGFEPLQVSNVDGFNQIAEVSHYKNSVSAHASDELEAADRSRQDEPKMPVVEGAKTKTPAFCDSRYQADQAGNISFEKEKESKNFSLTQEEINTFRALKLDTHDSQELLMLLQKAPHLVERSQVSYALSINESEMAREREQQYLESRPKLKDYYYTFWRLVQESFLAAYAFEGKFPFSEEDMEEDRYMAYINTSLRGLKSIVNGVSSFGISTAIDIIRYAFIFPIQVSRKKQKIRHLVTLCPSLVMLDKISEQTARRLALGLHDHLENTKEQPKYKSIDFLKKCREECQSFIMSDPIIGNKQCEMAAEHATWVVAQALRDEYQKDSPLSLVDQFSQSVVKRYQLSLVPPWIAEPKVVKEMPPIERVELPSSLDQLSDFSSSDIESIKQDLEALQIRCSRQESDIHRYKAQIGSKIEAMIKQLNDLGDESIPCQGGQQLLQLKRRRPIKESYGGADAYTADELSRVTRQIEMLSQELEILKESSGADSEHFKHEKATVWSGDLSECKRELAKYIKRKTDRTLLFPARNSKVEAARWLLTCLSRPEFNGVEAIYNDPDYPKYKRELKQGHLNEIMQCYFPSTHEVVSSRGVVF